MGGKTRVEVGLTFYSVVREVVFVKVTSKVRKKAM